MKKIFTLAAILMFALASCHNRTINCTITYVNLSLTGFADTDIAGGKIYEYKKDGMFDSLTDSASLVKKAMVLDTITCLYTFDHTHDYRIVLPKVGATYSITAITPDTHYTQSIQQGPFDGLVEYGCYNPIASYALNGTVYKAAYTSGALTVIYINK